MEAKNYRYISVNNRKFAVIAALLMMLSGIVRIVYYRFFYPDEVEIVFFFGQILLPLFSVFGFAFMAFLNKTNATIIPALAGVAFFIIKALAFGTLHKILCILLYMSAGVIYTVTISGRLPKKMPLMFTFALPLAAHIGLDIYEFATYESIVLIDYMPELSVLFIMAALLFFSYSISFKLTDKENKHKTT